MVHFMILLKHTQMIFLEHQHLNLLSCFCDKYNAIMVRNVYLLSQIEHYNVTNLAKLWTHTNYGSSHSYC